MNSIEEPAELWAQVSTEVYTKVFKQKKNLLGITAWFLEIISSKYLIKTHFSTFSSNQAPVVIYTTTYKILFCI